MVIVLFACNEHHDSQDSAAAPNREAELQGVIRSFPDSALAVENLIQYYRDSGKYIKAIATVNEALSADSGNARLWDIAGTLYFENEDTLRAIAAYEKSVQLFPDPPVLIALGAAYASTKNPRAVFIGDELLLLPKTVAQKEALFIKGLYFRNIGDAQKAIAFFDQVLALNYSFMEAYREKAQALYDQEKYEEAITVLNKAVTLKNSYDEGYFYLGRNLEKLNRMEEAREMYERALQYDPGYLEASDALKNLHSKK